MSNDNRTPAGIPTGGEFAKHTRDDALINLPRTVGTEDEWSEKYEEIRPPSREWLWEEGELHSVDSNRVWTVLDGDGNAQTIIAGQHRVNRAGYLVTQENWTDANEEFTIGAGREDGDPVEAEIGNVKLIVANVGEGNGDGEDLYSVDVFIKGADASETASSEEWVLVPGASRCTNITTEQSYGGLENAVWSIARKLNDSITGLDKKADFASSREAAKQLSEMTDTDVEDFDPNAVDDVDASDPDMEW